MSENINLDVGVLPINCPACQVVLMKNGVNYSGPDGYKCHTCGYIIYKPISFHELSLKELNNTEIIQGPRDDKKINCKKQIHEIKGKQGSGIYVCVNCGQEFESM